MDAVIFCLVAGVVGFFFISRVRYLNGRGATVHVGTELAIDNAVAVVFVALFAVFSLNAVAMGLCSISATCDASVVVLVGAGKFARFSLFVVSAAFIEEFLFRGFLMNFLASKVNVEVAILGQAALFALLHAMSYGWYVAMPIAVMGLVLGYLAYSTSTIWIPSAFHAGWNLGVALISPDYATVLGLNSTEISQLKPLLMIELSPVAGVQYSSIIALLKGPIFLISGNILAMALAAGAIRILVRAPFSRSKPAA